MGKKSLIKSTEKKKPTQTKTTLDKKSDSNAKTPLTTKKPTQKAKVAAEKVAAEKAAAEKAAAEKVAAEKAAAEKAAAEKAAAEKADPMDKTIKFAAIGFGLIFIVLVMASISNSHKYYLMPADGTIEMWQGDFAPMGKKLLISIPGAEMPMPAKPEYRKKEAFPLAFSYYISQADALAEVPGLPDFEGIKTYLHQALDYATDRTSIKTANTRVNTIEMLVLLYKAEATAGQATQTGFESAVNYLKEAAMLDIDATQRTLVEEKIKAVIEMKAELAALQAAEEAAAAEKAEAQQAAEEETQSADVENPVKTEKPQPTVEKTAHTEK